MHITVWNEFIHQEADVIRAAYPETLHEAVADAVRGKDATVETVTLTMPDQGLSDELLEKTDVLFWWGHAAHNQVSDALVEKIRDRVWRGMGMVFLHSSHMAKPFRALMGTSCTLSWREAGEKERLWVIDPTHPIAQGIPACTVLEHEEMYGEPFDIPTPDETVFLGWFQGGNVFRSGVTYKRGRGKIFYFQPGHELYPIYKQSEIRQILYNAARWACNPAIAEKPPVCNRTELLETL